MAFSLYDASVANYLQTIGAVSGFLERALTYFSEQNIDPETMVEARLAPGKDQDDEGDRQRQDRADDDEGERQRQVVPGGDPVQREQHRPSGGQRAFKITMVFSRWWDSTS